MGRASTRVGRRARVRDLRVLDVEPIVPGEPKAKLVLNCLAPVLSGASGATAVDEAFGVGFDFNTHRVEAALGPASVPAGEIAGEIASEGFSIMSAPQSGSRAYRNLIPLPPVGSGWIAIMFTDLNGSTELSGRAGRRHSLQPRARPFRFPVRPGGAQSWLHRQDRGRCGDGRLLTPRRRSPCRPRDPRTMSQLQLPPGRRRECDTYSVEARTSCRTMHRSHYRRCARLLGATVEYRSSPRTSVSPSSATITARSRQSTSPSCRKG